MTATTSPLAILARAIRGLLRGALSLCSYALCAACGSQWNPAFLTVQFCLPEEQNEEFMVVLESIANTQRLNFVDRSAEVTEQAAVARAQLPNPEAVDRVRTMVVLSGASDYSLVATDGGWTNQIVIMFHGPNTEKARIFAAEVNEQLAEHWKLIEIQGGGASTPLSDCAVGPSPEL